MDTSLNDRGRAFQTAIASFIDARREAKLKGKEGDAVTLAKYEHANWLADAARRVSQIQSVTHVLKATHPDARGSSLHAEPDALPQHREIGSHSLGPACEKDVVGNAAALDVFKFLKTEVDSRTLLEWMQQGDPDLAAALSEDPEQARAWMKAFASLEREEPQPTSHPLAKQVYWLVGDAPQDNAGYHLLQPLFSSTLAQAVHVDIQEARFGDASKAARQAKRKKVAADIVLHDYRDLAVRKLGGTKPQNISQLNSERGGKNYLLASLPPKAWRRRSLPRFLAKDSVLPDLYWYGNVRELLRTLTKFLKSNPDPTMETRNHRETIEQALGQELAMYGVEIRASQTAGWTRDAACRLSRAEQLWLDPDRSELPIRNDPAHPEWAEDDLAFNADYARGHWPDEVATRFGSWLNSRLHKAELVTVGDSELRHFARQAVLDVAWPIPLSRHATEAIA